MNAQQTEFLKGADGSVLDQAEQSGGIYFVNGEEKDAYQIFKDNGINNIRLKLWHSPDAPYNGLERVLEMAKRASDLGLGITLDFHYSDTWADPSQQQIPSAWVNSINDTPALGDLLYNYTYNTLNDLSRSNLLPDIVQIGNEINPMILQDGALQWPIDWVRNSSLLNKGIKAVRDISSAKNTNIEVMLHIAQPENGLWWFDQATKNGVADFDWIGLSYYPIWSDFNLNNLATPLSTLITTYKKRLMIVETAYPFTLEDADSANNIIGSDALIDGYPATQQGQLNYLNKLKMIIESVGGEGLIYWEPAWVSTDCSTLWGQGSHWDNATLFDHDYKTTLGMQFYNGSLQ